MQTLDFVLGLHNSCLYLIRNANTENIFYCLNIFKFETHTCPLKNSIYEPHATNMSPS